MAKYAHALEWLCFFVTVQQNRTALSVQASARAAPYPLRLERCFAMGLPERIRHRDPRMEQLCALHESSRSGELSSWLYQIRAVGKRRLASLTYNLVLLSWPYLFLVSFVF